MNFALFIFAACSICSCLYFNQVAGVTNIVPPFPSNPILIEGESAEVTCVAYNSDDVTKPANITFLKKFNIYGDTIPISDEGQHGSYNLKRQTELNGLRLLTTMVINKMNARLAGGYICRSWRPHDNSGRAVRPASHDFQVLYVAHKDLPKAAIHGGGTINYGDSAKLTCDVTDGSWMNAPLSGLAWMKDNVIIRNGTSATVLEPLIIKDASTQDGGEYKCVGVAKLKRSEPRSLLLNKTTVYVRLKVDNGTTEVKGVEGSSITMDCPAYGYPLNVTWWKMNRGCQQQQLVNNERYMMSSPCPTCRYRLTIKHLQPPDAGQYICKVKLNMQSGMHYFRLSINSSGVTYYAQSFLVLLTGLVTWKLL